MISNVLLVHGAFADGSSYSRVIPLLQAAGHTVLAAQLPLSSLDDDIAAVRRALKRFQSPVVLVGHSYGGTVISGAGDDLKVAALVYLAALAQEEGESVLDVLGRFPAVPSVQHYQIDEDGFAVIDPAHFPADFAADVEPETARVLATSQGPIHVQKCFGASPGAPAWKAKPSFYAVSENDLMVSPDAQRFMAARMNAQSVSFSASHATPLSRPPRSRRPHLASRRFLSQRKPFANRDDDGSGRGVARLE